VAHRDRATAGADVALGLIRCATALTSIMGGRHLAKDLVAEIRAADQRLNQLIVDIAQPSRRRAAGSGRSTKSDRGFAEGQLTQPERLAERLPANPVLPAADHRTPDRQHADGPLESARQTGTVMRE
jgi:hypothetical protein